MAILPPIKVQIVQQYCEIKMLRNVGLVLNLKIKMRRNPKIVKKYCEIQLPRKFHNAIISCFKVSERNAAKPLKKSFVTS